VNYNIYWLSNFEKIKYGAMGIGGFFLLAMLFYGQLMIALPFSFIGILYIPYQKKILISERKKRLKKQFKEGLYALSSSISVGKSVELAFVEALNDLKIIYYEEDTYIIEEFTYIVRKVSMNDSIESALLDFALRAEDEDITNFTNVFITAKRTGGNLVEIMKYTTTTINEKIEIMENINVLITGKKYEQKILAFLVPFIILYLHVFSSEFLEVMYHSLRGRIAMTVALMLYLVSFIVSKKVVEIEV